jgi:hypothetical protein
LLFSLGKGPFKLLQKSPVFLQVRMIGLLVYFNGASGIFARFAKIAPPLILHRQVPAGDPLTSPVPDLSADE